MRRTSRFFALVMATFTLVACAIVPPAPSAAPPASLSTRTGFRTQAITGGIKQQFLYNDPTFTYNQSGTIRWYSDASNGSFTPGNGNTITFSFTGSGLHIFGSKQARGQAAIPVTVDGVPYTMSCYNGGTTTPAYNQPLLDVIGLTSPSPHTVTITNPVRGKYVYFYRIETDLPGAPIVRTHLYRADPATNAPADLPNLDYVALKHKRYFFRRLAAGTVFGHIDVANYLKTRNPAIEVWDTDSIQTVGVGDYHYAEANAAYPASTSLTAAITAADMVIPVADGSIFPTFNFWIEIDGERMEIASRSGNMLTVLRRAVGTVAAPPPAAAHLNGAVVRHPHEDWFLHDAVTGERLVTVAGADPGYVMDVRSLTWQQQLRIPLSVMVSFPYFRGMLYTRCEAIPGADLQCVSGGGGTAPAGYAAGFATNRNNMLVGLRSVITTSGLIMGVAESPNVSATPGAPNLAAELAISDGVGHLVSQPDATMVNTADWTAQQSQWATLQGGGQIVAGHGGTPGAPGGADADRNFFYALGSYLLRYNATDTVGFWAGGGAYQPYYKAFEVPIGSPISADYADSGLMRRDFQNGVALVNPSTTTTVNYPFGNTLFVTGNGAVGAGSPSIPEVAVTYTQQTSVSIPPASAVVALFAI